MTDTKGTKDNPLTERDLPFLVPATGSYWLNVDGELIELPISPAGSSISIEEGDA